MLAMFRTIFFFPSAIMLFSFSRKEVLSSPRTIRPSSVTTDTPSTSLFVILIVILFLPRSVKGSPVSLYVFSNCFGQDNNWPPERGILFVSTASIAASFRSMCGSLRRPPECSKQGIPAVAPHVGQGTASKVIGAMSPILIGKRYHERVRKTVCFGTLLKLALP